ncbi:MAG: hypothetical protein L3J58_07945 [Emcibacter sp.]|nr:hypothetical protein [Emcibacter sp.]
MQKKAQFDDRIRNLIALAQDGSEHSRTLLFSHISDLFLQQRPMASAVQERMLVEILKELLNQVTLSARQEIAAALCALTSPPEQLINILCEDVVEVSGPILEKAILPDDKLIHLIRYGTEPHRIHISRRFGLSPLVRHELEKAFQDSQSSKLKYSLNELDKLSEDHVPHIDEETTANILELLRAQNIHNSYPETSPESPIDETAVTEESVQETAFTSVSEPEGQKETTKTLEEKLAGAKGTAQGTPADSTPISVSGHAPLQQAPYQDQNNIFQKTIVANDAVPPPVEDNQYNRENFGENISDNTPRHIQPRSIIHMNDATSDLADDICQQVQDTRNETDKQRDLVRSVADWFWEVDRTGLISFVSEEALSAFGCSDSTLIGVNFISLCRLPEPPPPPNGRDVTITDNDENIKQETFDFLFERRSSFRDRPFYITGQDDKETLWLISAIAVFDIHTGRFTGFRGSARSALKGKQSSPDVMSKNQNIQENILEKYVTAQTYKAKDALGEEAAALKAYDDEIATELLQNISHEFRTPLNAIIGFSEMIDMEAWGPVNAQYHKNTKNILTAAGHLKEAVNDVLDSAKLEAGLMPFDPESFSLKSVLKNSQENVKSLAEEHQVEFLDNSNNIDVILYNDKQSVELCLTKILASIIKRASGGEVIRPSVLINSNAQVRVEIPILGSRINEENAKKMFEKIKTEPDEPIDFPENNQKNNMEYAPKISSGFGLHVAKSLANMIGGDISVHITQGYVTHLALTLSNHEPASKTPNS